MRKIGAFDFAEQGNAAETLDWKPRFRVRALAHNILVVAKTRIEGTWNAYIKAVPGKCHDDEWQDAWRHGDKLPEAVALALFPEFSGVPYAN